MNFAEVFGRRALCSEQVGGLVSNFAFRGKRSPLWVAGWSFNLLSCLAFR